MEPSLGVRKNTILAAGISRNLLRYMRKSIGTSGRIKAFFNLIEAKYTFSEKEQRNVFKFVLQAVKVKTGSKEELEDFEFSRRIPTNIKKDVWERDNGKCQICGSKENLHFDHIIPFSKGGSSMDPKNVQILCGKHNLQKSAHII